MISSCKRCSMLLRVYWNTFLKLWLTPIIRKLFLRVLFRQICVVILFVHQDVSISTLYHCIWNNTFVLEPSVIFVWFKYKRKSLNEIQIVNSLIRSSKHFSACCLAYLYKLGMYFLANLFVAITSQFSNLKSWLFVRRVWTWF